MMSARTALASAAESARTGPSPGRAWVRRVALPVVVARGLDATTLAFVFFFHQVMGAKLRYSGPGFDEHYFLWEGFSLSRGMVPYRDFQEFKPPMIFVVNALALKLFGLQGMAYRKMFSLLALLSFLTVAVALLSRKVGRLVVAALVALMIGHYYWSGFHDSGIDNAESMGVFFFLMGSSILLAKTRFERTQQLAGGALLSLAPLSKEPLAFVTLAAWLTALLLSYFDSRRARSAVSFMLFTVAGVAGVVTLWVGYMLVTQSLSWYRLQLELSFAYSKNYAAQLGWFPKDPHNGIFDEVWSRLTTNYVNYARLGAFIPLFAATLFLWRRRFVIGIAALLALAAGVYAVTIGHGFLGHYYVMAMTGTFFAASVGAVALQHYARRSRGFGAWVGFSWALVALVALWPQYSTERDAKYVSPPPTVSTSEVAFVKSHTARDDRIFTTGDPLLYVYSDRLSAVREGNAVDELIDYRPGRTDEERFASERDELEHTMPKVIVIGDDAQAASRKVRTISALILPFVRDHGYTKVSDKFYVRP